MAKERATSEEYTIHANCNARLLAEDGWRINEVTRGTGESLWWPMRLRRRFRSEVDGLQINGEAVCRGMRCGVKGERILICSGEIRFDGKKLPKWTDDAGYDILKAWLQPMADDEVDDFGLLCGRDNVCGSHP